jgi:hypothetical protein
MSSSLLPSVRYRLGWSWIILVLCFLVSSSVQALDLYVDPVYGSDEATPDQPGHGQSPDRPFATLQAAADALAAHYDSSLVRPCWARSYILSSQHRTVHLQPGDYVLNVTLRLADAAHSHTAWRAAAPGTVRIRGGARIDPALFESYNSHPHILVAPLDNAVGDLGYLQGGRGLDTCAHAAAADVYWEGHPLTLARHPNILPNGTWTWSRLANVTGPLTVVTPYSWNWTSTAVSPSDDIWVHAFWGVDWADTYVRVAAAHRHLLVLDNTSAPLLYGPKPSARYYILNLLEALDTPGEYYIDRKRRFLYVYPPSPLTPTTEILVSTTGTLLEGRNLTNVTFAGLHWSVARGTAVHLANVTRVHLDGGSITAVGGDWALLLREARESHVHGVRMEDCACGGISLQGGNRSTLTASHNTVTHSTVRRYAQWKRTYVPALRFDDVGLTIAHNQFRDAPHFGVTGHGNDCVVQDNDFIDLATGSSDAAAFYAGRSWADRGNVVRDNRFVRIANVEEHATTLGYTRVQGVYLDDQMSGYEIFNNSFVDCDCGILLGGGRDNVLTQNRFVRTDLPVMFDKRGHTWDTQTCRINGTLHMELNSFGYQIEPWASRYPNLVSIMDDRPCTPVHNVIEGVHFRHEFANQTAWFHSPDSFTAELLLWDNSFAAIRQDMSLYRAGEVALEEPHDI